MSNEITLHNSKMPLVEYQGQRVVTFAMVDEVHQRPKGTAKAAFNRHKARFTKGKHFYGLNRTELNTNLKVTEDVKRTRLISEQTGDVKRRMSLDELFPKHTSSGIVITEMGYLLLVKPFTDELAWKVQEELVEAYFRHVPTFTDIRPVLIPSLDELEAMPLQQAQNILAAADEQSLWRHGKHGSAEMSQRRRELKVLRPAIHRINAIAQIIIPGLEVKA